MSPTRFALIERAIESAVGQTPGHETQQYAGQGGTCIRKAAVDAAEVALSIEREAVALQRESTTLATTDWSTAEPQLPVAGVSKWVNQWMGGMGGLRWASA